jgi:hypothetical protein
VSDAKNYLAKAAECSEQASKCPYPTDKASRLHLAERWTNRAKRSEAPAVTLNSRPRLAPVPLAPLARPVPAPVRTPAPAAAEFLARFFSEK